jgi:hypothetical protein
LKAFDPIKKNFHQRNKSEIIITANPPTYNLLKKSNSPLETELAKASKVVKVITKNDLRVLKAFVNPSSLVVEVLKALCFILKPNLIEKKDPIGKIVIDWWGTIKGLLCRRDLLVEMENYGKGAGMDDVVGGKLEKLFERNCQVFNLESVRNNSSCLKGIFEWVGCQREIYRLKSVDADQGATKGTHGVKIEIPEPKILGDSELQGLMPEDRLEYEKLKNGLGVARCQIGSLTRADLDWLQSKENANTAVENIMRCCCYALKSPLVRKFDAKSGKRRVDWWETSKFFLREKKMIEDL